VISAASLLVLAAIAIAVPLDVVTLAGSHFTAQTEAALRAEPQAPQISDGVPISLSIQNDSDEEDRLLGGSTPVAQCVAVRRALPVNGRRETAPSLEGIVIPAQATITLEPGTSHLALYGLQTDLVQGDAFALTLHFERAGDVTVISRVRRRVDAAGIAPLPEASLGDLTIALVSAPPASGP
jgi:periplasmic copper chaperone A